MIKGMSGFGQSRAEISKLKVNVVVRTLNHRYLDCAAYLPESLRSLEDYIKTIVKKKIKRGKVNISFEITQKGLSSPYLNLKVIGEYMQLAKKLNKALGVSKDVSFWQLLNLPSVLIERQDTIIDNSETRRLISYGLNRAIDAAVKMRRKEGVAIYEDLKRRVGFIRGKISHIEARLPKVFKRAARKLSAEELSAFKRNSDVSEEIVRLKFHLENLCRTAIEPNHEPKGKELDFICQELQREINTLGAKVQDKNISFAVVKIKSQLEKLREQLQNVE